MNKLFIYLNIIFFLLFQTFSSAEWITKKSNKYEKITEIENMYSEGYLSKLECEQAKSKILKTKDKAKTNCDNIKVYSASTDNDTQWNGIYEWNGQTVSKEYYCKKAKQNNMHKYYKEEYKLKCKSSTGSSSYITKKTKDKKRIICSRGATAFWHEPGNCSRSNDEMIHPNHSMYSYFLNIINEYEAKEKVFVENDKSYTQDEIINKLKNEMQGDYYVFAYSTDGEKFFGSTVKKGKSQIGVVYSSNGYSCPIVSKQITNYSPFRGDFSFNCRPSFYLEGTWVQQTSKSPGVGQALTDSGDVITAYFSTSKYTTVNFVNNFYKNNQTLIAKNQNKQKEYKPSTVGEDNEPPVIKIASTITVNDSFYFIKGSATDSSDTIYVKIVGGKEIKVKDGKFAIKRFNPLGETVKLVAIDKYGNKSKPKTVKIIVDSKDTEIAEKLEPLNPSMIKTKANNNRVALIVGIEKYEDSPVASYANMDAKFFYEYARKAFGVSTSNTKLLMDEDASEKAILKVVKKWLPAKVNRNTELIIFFAGHGLASNDGKELYILPHDTDTDLLEDTAISRSKLYEDIIKLKPKKVVMFMDTCYSGISRDEKTLLASARPLRLLTDESEGDMPSNFTVFSASQISQMSSGLKEAKHGIFSYYLMKGLEGKADQNSDKKITNGELLDYMNEQVAMKAAELGRQQNPSLLGDRNKVLITYN